MLQMLTTIIGLVSAGRAFTETPMYHRLVSGVAVLVALVVVTAMVFGALLIGLFYAAFLAFMAYGLESTPALIATLALGLLTLGLMIAATLHYIRNTFDLKNLVTHSPFPIASKVGGVANAFLDGIRGRPTH